MNTLRDEFNSASMFTLATEFDGLATGRTQVPSKRVSSSFRQVETDPFWTQSHDFIAGRSGPLFQHFLASIPCILEEMCRVNAALERLRLAEQAETGRTGHAFFALDAFDGSQARALTEMSGGLFSSHTCSPNPGNQAFFVELNRAANATFDQAPFFDAVETYVSNSENPGFDVIYETAAFQFYGKNRRRQIEITAEAMKEDGIFILLEKSLRNEPGLFELDETRKDKIHKTKYFNAQEISWKKQQMLQSMHDGLVPLDILINEAVHAFGHACVLWNGGNFFEIAACRSPERLRSFVNFLGAIRLDDGFVLDPRVGEWVSA